MEVAFIVRFGCCRAEKRNAMCALYAFARITDDIGDCKRTGRPADKVAGLVAANDRDLNLISEAPVDRVPLAARTVPTTHPIGPLILIRMRSRNPTGTCETR